MVHIDFKIVDPRIFVLMVPIVTRIPFYVRSFVRLNLKLNMFTLYSFSTLYNKDLIGVLKIRRG